MRTFDLVNKVTGSTTRVEARKGGTGWKALCPFHPDKNPSLSIDDEKGVYHCFGCGTSGRIADNYRGYSAAGNNPRSVKIASQQTTRTIVAEYEYKDEYGALLYCAVRYAPKDFAFKRSDGNGGWIYNLDGVRRVLFRLPELLKSTGIVYIVEGEKDVLTLVDWGLTATTNSGGAKTWRREFSDSLKGRDIVILPDNDEAGKEHADKVAQAISGSARSIKIVELPGLAPKEDVTDWIKKYGHTVDELNRLVGEAAEYSPVQQHDNGESQRVIYMRAFKPRPFTTQIIERFKFFSTGTTAKDDLYYYDEKAGLWRTNGPDLIARYCRKEMESLDDQYKQTEPIRQIEMDIRGMSWQEGTSAFPEPKLELIPCANGVFDLNTEALREFRPEDYFTWKLPWNYNSGAAQDIVDRIGTFLPEEKTSDLWDLLSYSLWRDYSYQKFFMLFGRGSNGKSLFVNILANLLGKDNVASMSLDEIQGNFGAVNLHRKLLNVSGEVSNHDLYETRLLKQLTGGDIVTADRKYQHAIQFKNYAKLVFLTNEVPKSRDNTVGFYRRAYLIEFPNQFKEEPKLMQEINDLNGMRQAYEGLLSVVLGHLAWLREQQFIFSNHRPPDEMRKEYEKNSNPLHQFIAVACEKKPNGVIEKSVFTENLNDWLNEQGYNSYSFKRLGREMKELGFEDTKRRIDDSTARVNCWEGIVWKS